MHSQQLYPSSSMSVGCQASVVLHLCLTGCVSFCVMLQMLVKLMPMGVFRAYSAAIRGANNIVGGISFVTIARMFGVQKSGSSAPALAEA